MSGSFATTEESEVPRLRNGMAVRNRCSQPICILLLHPTNLFCLCRDRGEVAKSQFKFKFEKARETAAQRLDWTSLMEHRPVRTYTPFETLVQTIECEVPLICDKEWQTAINAGPVMFVRTSTL